MIGAHVDIDSVLRAFARLKSTDGRKVFREARKPVRVDLRDHARSQSAPHRRWPALAATTLVRRSRGPKRRRHRLLGRLPSAFVITTGPDFVRAVSRVRWSRVHWRGGTAGHGARIPARDFMWISSKLKREVAKLFRRALWRAWKGR